MYAPPGLFAPRSPVGEATELLVTGDFVQHLLSKGKNPLTRRRLLPLLFDRALCSKAFQFLGGREVVPFAEVRLFRDR
jgi:hypothetical protein